MRYSVSARDLSNGNIGTVLTRDYPFTNAQCTTAFVSKMNEKAAELGLDQQTIFRNPSGSEVDGISLSTAKSLAIMTAYACGYGFLGDVWSKASHTVHIKGKSNVTVNSSVYNSALTNYYNVLGGKTGSGIDPNDPNKEYDTLVAVTEIEGVMVAGAIMDAQNANARFTAMKQLFDASKAVILGQTPGSVTSATKACSVYVPTCPRTYLADKMRVIYAQNENTATGVMSVTKVMTAIVALDYLTDVHKSIQLVEDDIVSGSGAIFQMMDTVTLNDLFYAMMLPSSNQAACAIGRMVGNEILKYDNYSLL